MLPPVCERVRFAQCAHLSLWYFFFILFIGVVVAAVTAAAVVSFLRLLLFSRFLFFIFLFLLSHRIYCMTDVENMFWVLCLVHERARSLIVIAYFVAGRKKYTHTQVHTRKKPHWHRVRVRLYDAVSKNQCVKKAHFLSLSLALAQTDIFIRHHVFYRTFFICTSFVLPLSLFSRYRLSVSCTVLSLSYFAFILALTRYLFGLCVWVRFCHLLS